MRCILSNIKFKLAKLQKKPEPTNAIASDVKVDGAGKSEDEEVIEFNVEKECETLRQLSKEEDE